MQRSKAALVGALGIAAAGWVLWWASGGDDRSSDGPEGQGSARPEGEASGEGDSPTPWAPNPEERERILAEAEEAQRRAPEVNEDFSALAQDGGGAIGAEERDRLVEIAPEDPELPPELLSSLPAGVALFRDALGRTCLDGVPAILTLGHPDWVGPGTQSRTQEELAGALVTERALPDGMTRTLRREGREGPVSLTSTLRWEGENPIESVVTVSGSGRSVSFAQVLDDEALMATVQLTRPGGATSWTLQLDPGGAGAAPSLPGSPWCVPAAIWE